MKIPDYPKMKIEEKDGEFTAETCFYLDYKGQRYRYLLAQKSRTKGGVIKLVHDRYNYSIENIPKYPFTPYTYKGVEYPILMATESRKKEDYIKDFKELVQEAKAELSKDAFKELLDKIEIELRAAQYEP